MRMHRKHLAPFAASLAFALLLTGCGLTSVNPASGSSSGTSGVGGSISGHVIGGNPPVTGSRIYLLAMGTTGYTSANTSLLTSGTAGTDSVGSYVLTDSNGNFSITGGYNCPISANTPVYVLAMGGNPGLGAGGSNPNLAMFTAVASCDTLKANAASTVLFINEVSTVVSTYALAPFLFTTGAPAGFGFSTTATNLSGLRNAANSITNIFNLATGTARATTVAGSAAVPVAEINSLADIIQSCINSSGGTAGNGSACGNLFTATTNGATAPTNTINALLNIAKAPARNVPAIFALSPASGAAFVPQLSSAPNDFTIALTYTGGGINTPQAIALDAAGNAWIANKNNSITEIDGSTGGFTSGASGFTSGSLDAPVSLSIDTTGKVWIANCGSTCSGSANASSLTSYTPSGSTVTAANFTTSGFGAMYSVAVAGNNNAVWADNVFSSTITLNNSIGAPISGGGYTAVIAPTWVAVDASGNSFSVSSPTNSVAGYSQAGAILGNSFSGDPLANPTAVAIDQANRLWVTNSDTNSLVVLFGGSPIAGAPFLGGGLLKPTALSLDGGGRAWITNATGRISVFTNTALPMTPSTGFQAPTLTYGNGISTDTAGNVWVTECGSYCTNSGTSTGAVIEFLGAALPTAMPLSLAANSNLLGAKP